MKYFYTIILGLLLGASVIGQDVITMTTSKPVGTTISFAIKSSGNSIDVDFGDGTITQYAISSNVSTISGEVKRDQIIKIYGEEITYFKCLTQQLTGLDVTQCLSLKDLYCNGNLLKELDISQNTSLFTLAIGYNNFTYATLPEKGNLNNSNYFYKPQKPISIAKNITTQTVLDLSSQYSIRGNTTAYRWMAKKGVRLSDIELVLNTDYTITEGRTTFLKPQEDSVYCLMYNTLYPELKGYFALETNTIKVISAPKQPQTIIFPSLHTKKIGDPSFALSATTNSSLPITYTSSNSDVASITGNNIVNILKAGTITITAAQGGDSNWEAASATQQLTITAAADTKKAQTINFETIPAKKLGDAAFELKATATSNLDVSFSSDKPDIVSITGTKVTILKAGTVTITAEQGGNGDWNTAESVTQTLIIGKKDQTINFDQIQPKKLGEAAFDLKATATSSLNVTFASNNSAIASISGTKVTILKAGTVIITASQAGNADWNAAEPVTQTLTISKKDQIISFDPIQPKKVGDPAFNLSAKASSNLAVTFSIDNTDVASLTGAKVTIRKAGTMTITATQAGNADREPASTSQKLTISSTTGINEEEEDNLSIYPNPVTETLYIKSKGLENPNISIFNILGTNVWSGRVTGQSINVSQLPAGIYLLRISNKNVVKTIRFEKQ